MIMNLVEKEYMDVDYDKILTANESTIDSHIKGLKLLFDKKWFKQTSEIMCNTLKINRKSLKFKQLFVAECMMHIQKNYNQLVDGGELVETQPTTKE